MYSSLLAFGGKLAEPVNTGGISVGGERHEIPPILDSRAEAGFKSLELLVAKPKDLSLEIPEL